jgi:hypothetical protein
MIGVLLMAGIVAAGLPKPASAEPPKPPKCRMAPPAAAFALPAQGMIWQSPGEEGACEEIDASLWVREPAGDGDLFVYADGPGGSGRFWEVSVGLAPAHADQPTRGFCLMATTLGWRSLQNYDRVPLEWLRRAERDGVPEVIIWDSFQAGDSESPPDAAIVAWAYRLSGDRLVLNLDSTKEWAADLARSYRSILPHEGPYLREVRDKAVSRLTALAQGDCLLESPE